MEFFDEDNALALKKIATAFEDEQYVKLAEECSELAIASMRYRAGRDNNLEEEIADVLIMIYQVAFLSKIRPEVVKNIAHNKIMRTLKRMYTEARSK